MAVASRKKLREMEMSATGSIDRNQNSQGEEYKDFGPNSREMLSRIETKRLKGSQEDDDDGPSVPHGEWQMNEQLITE